MFSNYEDVFISNLDEFYQSDQKVLKGYKLKEKNFEMKPGEKPLVVNSIAIDKNDVIWISANNGIFYYQKDPFIKKIKLIMIRYILKGSSQLMKIILILLP